MKKTHRLLAALLAALLALAVPVLAESAVCPQVETGIQEILKYGNIILEISGDALLDQGYEFGDIVTVGMGGKSFEAPVCHEYNDVEVGAIALRIIPSTDDDDRSAAILAINMGDLASWLGIAEFSKTDEDPGYRWDYVEPYRDGVTVAISLKEKGGYLDQLSLSQLVMSNAREDYPDLTDAQFANFRNIATTGMGAYVLYRSSSPVNPAYGRNHEADEAVNAAGICTVVNLADNEAAMKGFEDYAYSYYSRLDVIPLDLVTNYENDSFRSGLAEGLRFMAGHDGPYLVHCTLGKDRAGFACAVLECLMGASADEVAADYMASYYNYYGIGPDDEQYEAIADSNIRRSISRAFGIGSLEDADLAACAEAYLLQIGMTEGEIAALKDRLGTDIN